MDKRPLSRTQKIELWGIVIAAILGIIGWFAKIELNNLFFNTRLLKFRSHL